MKSKMDYHENETQLATIPMTEISSPLSNSKVEPQSSSTPGRHVPRNRVSSSTSSPASGSWKAGQQFERTSLPTTSSSPCNAPGHLFSGAQGVPPDLSSRIQEHESPVPQSEVLSGIMPQLTTRVPQIADGYVASEQDDTNSGQSIPQSLGLLTSLCARGYATLEQHNVSSGIPRSTSEHLRVDPAEGVPVSLSTLHSQPFRGYLMSEQASVAATQGVPQSLSLLPSQLAHRYATSEQGSVTSAQDVVRPSPLLLSEPAHRYETSEQGSVTSAQAVVRPSPLLLSEPAHRYETSEQGSVTSAQAVVRPSPLLLSPPAHGYATSEQGSITSAQAVVRPSPLLLSPPAHGYATSAQSNTSPQVVPKSIPFLPCQSSQSYMSSDQESATTPQSGHQSLALGDPSQSAQGYGSSEQERATTAAQDIRRSITLDLSQPAEAYDTPEQEGTSSASVLPTSVCSQRYAVPEPRLLPGSTPGQGSPPKAPLRVQDYERPSSCLQRDLPLTGSNEQQPDASVVHFQIDGHTSVLATTSEGPVLTAPSAIPTNVSHSHLAVVTNPSAMTFASLSPLSGSSQFTHIRLGPRSCPYIISARADPCPQNIPHSSQDLNFACTLPTNQHENPTDTPSNPTNAHDNPTDSLCNTTSAHDNPIGTLCNTTSTHDNPIGTLCNTTSTHDNPTDALSNTTSAHDNPIGTLCNTTSTHDNPTDALGNTTSAHDNPTDALGNPTDALGNVLPNGRTARHFIELLPHGRIHRKELDAYLNPSLDKSTESVGDLFYHESDISIADSGSAVHKQAPIENMNENSSKDTYVESSERLNHARLILGLMGMEVPENFESLSNGTIRTSLNTPLTEVDHRNAGVMHNSHAVAQTYLAMNSELGTDAFLKTTQNMNASLQTNLSRPITKQSDCEERNFKCSLCSKKFKKKAHLTTHELRHSGGKPHECAACGKTYSDVGTYNRHMKTHSGEKDCICVVCGKAFYDSGALTNHFKVHTGEKMHVCWICGKAFSHSGGLQVHVRSHTGERPYQCTQCGKSFSKSSKLVVHSRSHTGVKPYQCRFCFKTFNVSSNHRAHLRTHTGAKTFKCTVCGKMFGIELDLEAHLESHVKPPLFECKKCGKKYVEEIRFQEHFTKHTGQKLFKCNLCNKDFKRLANYNFHMKYHVVKPYNCDLCRRGFCKYADLVRHKKVHTVKKMFKCDTCTIEFTMLITLQVHRLRMHGPEKTYKCELCQRCFRRQEDLRVHTRTHTGQRPYKCECGFGFCGPSGLRKHMLKKHPEQAVNAEALPAKISKVYRCNVCGRLFKQSSHLKAHCVRHTGKKPHQCDVCGKRFTDLGMLNRHTRIHNGDRPHTCLVCKKGFIDAGSLQKHMTTHTGVKPYTCNQCSTSFSFPGDLQVHKRSHSGEKPFKCTLCDKAFTKSSKLLVHSRIHTGVKPYKCSFCGKEFSVSSNLKTHLKIHPSTDETASMFKCDVCSKTFLGEVAFQHHRASKHSKYQPQTCDVCGAAFNQPHRLQEHSFVHTGQKPFKCGECGKDFMKLHNYNSHLLAHSSVKLFACQTCGRTFVKTGDLKNHLRSHSADNGIKCEFCTDAFKQAKDLHDHFLRCHAPDKVHVCEDCGKGFDKLSDFKIHRRTHTGERPFACPHCHRCFCSSGGLKKHKLKCHTDYGQFQSKPLAVAAVVYSCGVCGQAYHDSDALQEHLLTHSTAGGACGRTRSDFMSSMPGCTAMDEANVASREGSCVESTCATTKTRSIELVVPGYPQQ